MYIISKFYDYYDSVMKLGIDKSIKYIRNTEVVDNHVIFSELDKIRTTYNLKFNELNLTRFLISICGNYYNGIYFNDYYTNDYKRYFVYNINMFLKIIKNTRYKDFKYTIPFSSGFSQKIFDLHVKYKTPILLNSTFCSEDNFKNWTLVKDPNLKYFEFNKVLDNYTIFQKIQQFISGVLTSIEKEPWPISDVLKAESKGFNELSFRRQIHPRKSKLMEK